MRAPAARTWPATWLGRRLLMLLVIAACRTHEAHAAADTDLAEYQIKAAFLCKFGQFVEWPGVAGDTALPFVIGVMASAGVVDELVRAAQGHLVHGRPLQVRRIQRAAEAAEGTAVVFIARSHMAHAGEVLAALRDRPVLTVTDFDATATGDLGIINFVVVDDKVRFDIALPAATRAGLRISARLLAVARQVTGRASP